MIQSIKIHLEWSQIQDMGTENSYILSLHIVNQFHMKSDFFFFFLQKLPWMQMWFRFFLQQFNKQEVN